MPSDSPSDAFLSGAGIPVALADIDAELARLWGPAAERAGGPEPEHPTVTRIVLANLVAADLGPGPSRVAELLPTVSRRYPSRLIVLRPSDRPERQVTAEVSAVCHLPAPGLPQVCAEQIVLRASPNALDLLPGAIRGVLETDLPMVLWWSGDPQPHADLLRDLADESSRLILDLPDPDAEPAAVRLALDLRLNLFDRDLAWFGITPWRELLAQFFDTAGCACNLANFARVAIDAVASSIARPPRVALWLAGWLAGQLGWERIDCRAAGAGTLLARFRGPSGEVRVDLRTTADQSAGLPHLTGVRVEAGCPCTFLLNRLGDSPDVIAEAAAPGHDPLPRLLRAPEWDAARRLAAALESARDDPPYRAALPHVLWMLDATG